MIGGRCPDENAPDFGIAALGLALETLANDRAEIDEGVLIQLQQEPGVVRYDIAIALPLEIQGSNCQRGFQSSRELIRLRSVA